MMIEETNSEYCYIALALNTVYININEVSLTPHESGF